MDNVGSTRLADVESLLRARIGLNPQAVHSAHVEDAIRERMVACRISEPSLFISWLETHAEEWQALIERLVVVESWFFRDVQPFRFLEKYVRADWQTRDRGRPLRLLSVPCGSGEEPLSAAMTLLNRGFDPKAFHIDGVDICQRALNQAWEGSYGVSSFREREELVADFRSRYFHASGPQRIANDDLRSTVRFRHGNLVEPGFLAGEPRYDVILCRNLLIYLDANARRVTFANLQRLLEPDGVLYVGHAEGGIMRGTQFEGYDPAFPFAFCIRGEKALVPAKLTPTIRKPTPIDVAIASDQFPKISIAPTAKPIIDLESARAAADGGKLKEAVKQCEVLLARDNASASVFCLLGVIHQAQGNLGEAEKFFNKSLYLDPRHHESLVHLGLLAAKRGEDSVALNYRKRAEKAEAKQ